MSRNYYDTPEGQHLIGNPAEPPAPMHYAGLDPAQLQTEKMLGGEIVPFALKVVVHPRELAAFAQYLDDYLKDTGYAYSIVWGANG